MLIATYNRWQLTEVEEGSNFPAVNGTDPATGYDGEAERTAELRRRLEALAAEFPGFEVKEVPRKVLLNPGPATMSDNVRLAQLAPDICPRETEFADLMRGIREDLVRVVHGDPNLHTAVPFCGSGTINMDVCLNSLLPPEKKILVLNNGAYSTRGADICRYYDLPHYVLDLPVDRPIDPEEVRAALQEYPDVGLVYTTHHETGTGVLNPIREIGALVRAAGAYFVVDTTASLAMLPLNLCEDPVDFVMSSAQKGLMAVTGLSFVIGRRDIIEASAGFPKRSYYCNLYRQYNYFETTGEMHFTPPVQAVYALRAAIDEYFAVGEETRFARHQELAALARRELAALGFREMIAPEHQSGLVLAYLYPTDPNWSFTAVHDYCYERGFTIYPGKVAGLGCFRICTLGTLVPKDIENFAAVMKEALIATGVALPVTYAS